MPFWKGNIYKIAKINLRNFINLLSRTIGTISFKLVTKLSFGGGDICLFIRWATPFSKGRQLRNKESTLTIFKKKYSPGPLKPFQLILTQNILRWKECKFVKMEKCLLFEGEDNYENKERCYLGEKLKTNIFVCFQADKYKNNSKRCI